VREREREREYKEIYHKELVQAILKASKIQNPVSQFQSKGQQCIVEVLRRPSSRRIYLLGAEQPFIVFRLSNA
jgi:hypothetical protein